jgi:hypothetical protein
MGPSSGPTTRRLYSGNFEVESRGGFLNSAWDLGPPGGLPGKSFVFPIGVSPRPKCAHRDATCEPMRHEICVNNRREGPVDGTALRAREADVPLGLALAEHGSMAE